MAIALPYAYTCVEWDLPGGQNAYIKCFWQVTNPPGLSSAGDTLDAFNIAFSEEISLAWADLGSVKAAMVRVKTYLVTLTFSFDAEYPVNLSGDVPGDMAPNAVAALIEKRSSRPGRSGVGRFFIPGIPETGTTENNLDGSTLTKMGVLAAALLESRTAVETTFAPAMFHPKTQDLSSVVLMYPIPLLATMRTRKPR